MGFVIFPLPWASSFLGFIFGFVGVCLFWDPFHFRASSLCKKLSRQFSARALTGTFRTASGEHGVESEAREGHGEGIVRADNDARSRAFAIRGIFEWFGALGHRLLERNCQHGRQGEGGKAAVSG